MCLKDEIDLGVTKIIDERDKVKVEQIFLLISNALSSFLSFLLSTFYKQYVIYNDYTKLLAKVYAY